MDALRPARLLAAAVSIAVHFLLRLIFGNDPYVLPLLWVSAFAFVAFLVGSMPLEDSLWVLHGARVWIIAFGRTAQAAIRVWHEIGDAARSKRKTRKSPRRYKYRARPDRTASKEQVQAKLTAVKKGTPEDTPEQIQRAVSG